MDGPGTYTIRATFGNATNVAALLKVLSVLHTRVDEVLNLCFDAGSGDEAVLTGRVRLLNTGPESLAASLRRPIDVLEAQVSRST